MKTLFFDIETGRYTEDKNVFKDTTNNEPF